MICSNLFLHFDSGPDSPLEYALQESFSGTVFSARKNLLTPLQCGAFYALHTPLLHADLGEDHGRKNKIESIRR